MKAITVKMMPLTIAVRYHDYTSRQGGGGGGGGGSVWHTFKRSLVDLSPDSYENFAPYLEGLPLSMHTIVHAIWTPSSPLYLLHAIRNGNV